ncbi:hypothetical protein ACVQ92_04560 [Staphylococcus aureus]
MKTVIDKPRTERTNGQINRRFKQSADDFNFKVKPCLPAILEQRVKLNR